MGKTWLFTDREGRYKYEKGEAGMNPTVLDWN